MIKILHLISSLETGGTEKMLIELLRGLESEKSQKHIVCTLYDKGQLKKEIEKEKIEYFTLGLKSKYFLPLAIPKFINLIKKTNPDLIISYLLADNLVARISAKITRKKLICGKRNLNNLISPLNIFLDNITLKLCEMHISNSKEGIYELEKNGIKKEKIIYIPNGKKIPKLKLSKKSAKEKIGLNKNDFVIGYVARLFKTKGHSYLLKASAKAIESEKKSNLKLVLVGNGNLMNELQKQVQELKLENRVVFLGERKNIDEILNAFDLFVFPSLSEGMPGALIEAMAFGLPILASDINANKELVKHMKNGILFEAGNSNELSEWIIKMKYDEKLRKNLGKKALETVKKEFLFETMIKKYKEVFDKVGENK